MQRDDGQLVRDCLDGQRGAWDELVRRYSRLVYSIPLRHGLSPADADDVTQTVFGIVLRKLGTLKDHARLAPWLIRTTYRECWSHRRASRAAAPLADDVVDASSPPADELARWERQHRIRTALENLDERCRKLLEALFFARDEPSYIQIAAELNIKVGSIGPTRARCFKKLESLLGDLEW